MKKVFENGNLNFIVRFTFSESNSNYVWRAGVRILLGFWSILRQSTIPLLELDKTEIIIKTEERGVHCSPVYAYYG